MDFRPHRLPNQRNLPVHRNENLRMQSWLMGIFPVIPSNDPMSINKRKNINVNIMKRKQLLLHLHHRLRIRKNENNVRSLEISIVRNCIFFVCFLISLPIPYWNILCVSFKNKLAFFSQTEILLNSCFIQLSRDLFHIGKKNPL